MQLAGRQLSGQTSMPFGPFLAIGLLFTLSIQQLNDNFLTWWM
jgi:leader peptidase (prepilin peptidase) / N-methyltransferase